MSDTQLQKDITLVVFGGLGALSLDVSVPLSKDQYTRLHENMWWDTHVPIPLRIDPLYLSTVVFIISSSARVLLLFLFPFLISSGEENEIRTTAQVAVGRTTNEPRDPVVHIRAVHLGNVWLGF